MTLIKKKEPRNVKTSAHYLIGTGGVVRGRKISRAWDITKEAFWVVLSMDIHPD